MSEGKPVAGRREIMAPELAAPISHYVHAVRFGSLVFLSSCSAVDAAGNIVGGDDVVAQSRRAFENVRNILEAAGATFADIVKITIYLADIDDRPKINPVRQEFFGQVRPASTLVEVPRLTIPGARIEVDTIATVPDEEG
jgi:2-iminobutanoate/2-iminopropanoate deaminase